MLQKFGVYKLLYCFTLEKTKQEILLLPFVPLLNSTVNGSVRPFRFLYKQLELFGYLDLVIQNERTYLLSFRDKQS